MTLDEILDLNARKFGSKNALRYEGKGITFTELKKRAEQTAAILQSKGVGKGDSVAVMSHNTPGFVYAFFGTLKAGAAVVPINHKLTAPEVAYQVDHSNSMVFLFDGSLTKIADALEVDVTRISLDSPAKGTEQLEPMLDGATAFSQVPLQERDTAEILYTSGTTEPVVVPFVL